MSENNLNKLIEDQKLINKERDKNFFDSLDHLIALKKFLDEEVDSDNKKLMTMCIDSIQKLIKNVMLLNLRSEFIEIQIIGELQSNYLSGFMVKGNKI